MEETTTNEAVIETGVQETQPEEQQPAADNTQSEPIQTESQEPETDNSLEWLSKKGIDPTSPDALARVAEQYRNAEKAMHKNAQERSQLEKQLTSTPEQYSDDPNNEVINELYGYVKTQQTKETVRDFFDRHPEARELEQDMASYISSSPEKGLLVKEGYLSLDDVYAIVSSSPQQAEKLRSQGKVEGLQQLANKQRTTAVTGNAVNSTPAPSVTKENAESWWTSLSRDERRSPENIRKLDSLLS